MNPETSTPAPGYPGSRRHVASDAKLTNELAYRAMFAFLDTQFERSRSGDLGVLLGGMSLLRDGTPADPALWADWEHAVDRVLAVYTVISGNHGTCGTWA